MIVIGRRNRPFDDGPRGEELGNLMKGLAESGRATWGPGVFVCACVAAVVVVAWYLHGPPSPLPADAPATEFSAYRAFEHDKAIAQVPHPAGSRANEKVRDYLLETLAELGVEAEVHVGEGDGDWLGVVENVLARIPGTANTRAFALAAHYDSVPYGPGAADDCAGVSAMLETARALKAGPPLMNDVMLLFTDAEEDGLLGAKAFTAHPWAQEIGVLLNFEARGSSGPSFMFETSSENGWLIAEMMKAGVHPRANSLMYDIYKPLPFDTDLTAFREGGLKGLNVAYIDDFAHYHTREDKPENLSLASLQHHGSYALGLARHFGSIPLDDVTAPDATYFNTLGSHMIAYPLSWGKWFAVGAAVLLAAVLLLGAARGHLTASGVAGGAGVLALTVLASALVCLLLTGTVFLIHGHYLLYNNNLYGYAFVCLVLAIFVVAYTAAGKCIRVQDLSAGASLWGLAALAAMAIALPGGSFLVLWPLVFATIALAILFLSPNPEALPPQGIAALVVFSFPGILLCVPIALGLLGTLTLLFSFGLAMVEVLVLSLLIPQVALVTAASPRWLPAVAWTAGLVLLVAALATNGASPAKPHYDCLSYGADLDRGATYWLSNDRKPDEWTSQFFSEDTPRAAISEFIPGDGKAYAKAPAPMADVEGPEVTVMADEARGGQRDLVLQVVSPRQVPQVWLSITSKTEVFSSELLGCELDGAREGWSGKIKPFPREGLEWRLTVDTASALRVTAIEMSYGLPQFPEFAPRPDHLITEPNTTLDWGRRLRSERTFVTKSFTFPVNRTESAAAP